MVSSPAGRLRLSSDRSAKTVQQPDLGRQRPVRELRARGQVAGQRAAPVARVDVETEQHAAQVRQAPLHPLLGGEPVRLGGQVQVGRGGCGGGLGPGVVERLQAQQRGAGPDLATDGDHALAQPRAERRPQHGLHLHALEHQHRGARLDLVARRHRCGHHQRGRGGAHDAALVLADPVGDAVHLDQVDRTGGAGDQAESVVVEVDLPRVLAEPLQHRVDGRRVVPGDEPDPVAARAGLGDGEPVAGAAQRQVDRAAALVLHLRAAAVRGGQQPLQLGLLSILVDLDRRGGERDTGVLLRRQPALRRATRSIQPVSALPSMISGSSSRPSTKLLLVVPPSMRTVVSAHRAAQPGQRLVAVRP